MPLRAGAAAAQTLRSLGQLLGLFRLVAAGAGLTLNAGAGKFTLTGGAADFSVDADLTAQLLALLIQLRNDARQSKNFPLADAVRNGLSKIGITLEDRADGTGWHKT